MKKFVSLIAVLLIVSSCLVACSKTPKETVSPTAQETEATPKDADYLYDWLTEHGTLVGGTCLQYSGTDASGTKFTLCYDTSYVDKLRWYVQYTTTDASGRTIVTQLFLFCDDANAMSRISVYGYGTFDDYYRGMEYSHKPKTFTKNSPIEHEDSYGSTVNINKVGKDVIAEVHKMNTICEDNAQKNLCLILDWLKDSLCTTASMKMSDFGYDRY